MKYKTIAVIGLGQFGTTIAKMLASMNHEVLGVDINPEIVQKVSPYVTHAIVADTTDEEAIKALALSQFDIVIVAIGDNISLALHAVFVSEASVHIAREWLTYASDLAPTFSILTVIYELLVIANIVLLVFMWLPGTNIFMRQAKTYRLALNTTAQSVTGQHYKR